MGVLARAVALLTLAVVSLTMSSAARATTAADPTEDPLRVRLEALTPSTWNAYYDRPPVYENGCHAGQTVTVPKFCVYGDAKARKVMVVFGDSHMAQWWGALDRAATRDGYRLLWATKSACPAPVVSVRVWRSSQPYYECDVWRRAMLDKIADLPRVDLVVMSGYHWHVLRYPGTNTVIKAGEKRESAWHDGLARSVRKVRASADHVLILRDTPHMRTDVPSCLRSSGGDTSACSVSVSNGLSWRLWRAERQVADDMRRVRAVQMTSHLCVDGRCRPVTQDRTLRYRDDTHLTTTFVRQLTWWMRREITLTVG